MNRPNIPARPTVYKGIQMRSRLEADFASSLDQSGAEWEYEPTCFGGPEDQWLPDFRLSTTPRVTYVELKSAHILEKSDGEDCWDAIDRIDQCLRKMSVAWLSEPKVTLELVFWIYGGSEALIIIGDQRDPGRTWLAIPSTPCASIPLIWPGMGQFEMAFKPQLDHMAAAK